MLLKTEFHQQNFVEKKLLPRHACIHTCKNYHEQKGLFISTPLLVHVQKPLGIACTLKNTRIATKSILKTQNLFFCVKIVTLAHYFYSIQTV